MGFGVEISFQFSKEEGGSKLAAEGEKKVVEIIGPEVSWDKERGGNGISIPIESSSIKNFYPSIIISRNLLTPC